MEREKQDEGDETSLSREKLTNIIKQMNPGQLEEFIDQGIKAGIIPSDADPIEALQSLVMHLANSYTPEDNENDMEIDGEKENAPDYDMEELG